MLMGFINQHTSLGGPDNGIFSESKPWCPQKHLKIDG